jgi:hypothetical protein
VISLDTAHEQRAPHPRERNGYYSPGIIDLTQSCEHCYPRGILLWVLRKGTFGTWECDRLLLTVFRGVSWSEICTAPVLYLSTQWEGGASEYAAPWEFGEWREGRP